jgi:HlyD family secretion protein
MALLLAACAREQPGVLQGYVEGEFANVAAPAAGTLTRLAVKRGDTVKGGATLFTLDSVNEEAERRQAAEQVKSAEQKLSNLQTGRRPPEVAVTAAQTEQAAAARRLSELQWQQQQKLFASGFISRAALDEARANYDRDIGRVAESEAQGRVARLSLGRDAEIHAAAADADAARASLAQAEWRLAQRGAAAPADADGALVQDTYFVEGEWVPSGRPVVSLLPVGNVKVRFFVPETQVGAIHPGDAVSISCDGCPAPVPAHVSFISTQAEFTPPIIYSKDSRAKLVFMIEARPSREDGTKLRPGQPVDVTLGSATPGGTKSTAP